MTRDMYDSVTASDIPSWAPMVGGYIDGTYRWSAADWARFPNAIKVEIATRASTNGGHCLDVEPGAASPQDAPNWVLRRRNAGVDPSVYCNQLNGWQEVQREFRLMNVPQPHYWVAHYDGSLTIPPGAVAKQYANPARHGQGHFDLSIVADYWPGVDMSFTDTTQAQIDDMQLRIASMHAGQYLPWPNVPGAPGGDLTWVQQQLATALAPIHAALEALQKQPAAQAQAIADALGPDLGAAVLAALKAKL